MNQAMMGFFPTSVMQVICRVPLFKHCTDFIPIMASRLVTSAPHCPNLLHIIKLWHLWINTMSWCRTGCSLCPPPLYSRSLISAFVNEVCACSMGAHKLLSHMDCSVLSRSRRECWLCIWLFPWWSKWQKAALGSPTVRRHGVCLSAPHWWCTAASNSKRNAT